MVGQIALQTKNFEQNLEVIQAETHSLVLTQQELRSLGLISGNQSPAESLAD